MALDIILGAPIVTAYLNGGSHSLLCYSSVAEKQQFWTKSWLKPWISMDQLCYFFFVKGKKQ